MNQPNAIHVAIADDHPMIREGLAAVINREPDMEVVDVARNWQEAVNHAVVSRPEIAVLDLLMPGMGAVEGVTAFHEKVPKTQIIIFSAYGTNEEIFQVLRAGVRGYVFKGESGREDLLTCLRAVSRGEIWIHPVAAARLGERMTTPNLTGRELDVLRRMAQGKSNKEIGATLEVTEGTVKVHVNHILAKLGANGRVAAIVAAAQRGLISLAESRPYPYRSFTGPENTLSVARRATDGLGPNAASSGITSGQTNGKK